MPTLPAEQNGLKILVVEDNLLVAETVAAALEDNGYEVVGPAPTLAKGLKLASDVEIDGAVLDINLAGRFCFPIAALLRDRKVPFLFLTGYDDPMVIPSELRSAGRLSKPFHLADLGVAAARAFRRSA